MRFIWRWAFGLSKHHPTQVGVSDRVWDAVDIVKLVEEAGPKPGKRGPYKKAAV